MVPFVMDVCTAAGTRHGRMFAQLPEFQYRQRQAAKGNNFQIHGAKILTVRTASFPHLGIVFVTGYF